LNRARPFDLLPHDKKKMEDSILLFPFFFGSWSSGLTARKAARKAWEDATFHMQQTNREVRASLYFTGGAGCIGNEIHCSKLTTRFGLCYRARGISQL
jgi:hypothetical protein